MSRDNTLKPGTPQREAWKGQFSDGFVNRNEVAAWKIPQGAEAYRRILGKLEIDSILGGYWKRRLRPHKP